MLYEHISKESRYTYNIKVGFPNCDPTILAGISSCTGNEDWSGCKGNCLKRHRQPLESDRESLKSSRKSSRIVENSPLSFGLPAAHGFAAVGRRGDGGNGCDQGQEDFDGVESHYRKKPVLTLTKKYLFNCYN